MTQGTIDLATRAVELRRAFDRSFADAPRPPRDEFIDLLAVLIGGDPYAIALAEVSALLADASVTPLPTTVAELAGIAAIRGAIVPIYDLRRLLGYGPRPSSRWVVLSTAATRVGFTFDAFDRHLRVARADLAPADAAARSKRHVTHVVRADDVVRPVLALSSACAWIEARVRGTSPQQER